MEKPSVLIIDDDPRHRELFAEIIKSMDMDPQLAPDAQSALDILASSSPDLIILDIMMPFYDGLSFLKEIRSNGHYPKVPVIVISARFSLEAKLEAFEAGADEFLVKPVGLNEVQQAVKNMMAKDGFS